MENHTSLTEEQKDYICSKTINGMSFLLLILGIYLIYINPIFIFFGAMIIFSFIREYQFSRAVRNNTASVIIGEVISKYEKDPHPHASKNRKWMIIIQTDSGEQQEYRVNFHFYEKIDIRDKVIRIETRSIKRFFKCK